MITTRVRAGCHLGERLLGRELRLAVDVVRGACLRRADVDEAPRAFTRRELRGVRRAFDVDSPELVPSGPRMRDVGEMHDRFAAAHVCASHVVAARAQDGTERAADEAGEPGDQDAHRAGYYNRPMLAVIGGSGVYNIEGLRTRNGRGRIGLRRALGRGAHRRARGRARLLPAAPRPRPPHPPSGINYRANIEALKRLGVTDIISVSAVGSLREHLAPGMFVIIDQFIDRTFAREKSFFGEGLVAHVSMARRCAGGSASTCTPRRAKPASTSRRAAPTS